MGEKQTPKVDILLPSQLSENTPEKTGAGASGAGYVEEMPTVTTLLRRKKLGAAKPLEPVPAENFAEPQTVALQQSAEPAAVPTVAAVSLESEQEAAPAITPSRRRAARVVVAEEEENSAPQQAASSEPHLVSEQQEHTFAGPNAGPPPFRLRLAIESMNIKQFGAALRKHKRSISMKRLDALGYFSSRYTEMAYFEVVQPGMLGGVLGYGNPTLVAGVIDQTVTAETLPSVFEMVSQGEIFAGPIESLRAEDQNGLSMLGFSATSSLGVFPVIEKKMVVGVWICTSPHSVDFPLNEQKAVKALLPNVNRVIKGWWPF